MRISAVIAWLLKSMLTAEFGIRCAAAGAA
jgi:hypothetical protein